MNFENWWRSKYPAQATEEEFNLLREAWNAAVNAEREARKAIQPDISP